MAAILAPMAFQKWFDADGNPLAGGLMYTYEAGGEVPKATYTDDTGGVANANPVVLDANGQADIWILSGYYKFVLKNAAGVTQWTQDRISLPTVDNGFTTGDVKMSIKTVADTGWVLMNDGTIGNAASSATSRANADTVDLYALLWANTANGDCAVSTGRGASAAADYAAGKTIALPKALGRALACYGSGSGLTARTMAAIVGVETHTLTEAQMPVHTHVQTSHNHTQDAHVHVINGTSAGASGQLGSFTDGNDTVARNSGSTTATNQATTAVNANAGSGSAHPNMQPTSFLNIMIKL